MNDVRVPLKAADFIILPPGTIVSTSDRGKSKCQILTWIWLSPPHDSLKELHLRTNPKPVHRETIRQLVKLHEETRREIAQADKWTGLALSKIRLELDISLARNGAQKPVDSRVRYRLAEDFLLQHPEIHQPVAALADYLQISKSTVKRLFSEHGSATVKEKSHHHRMITARKRLGRENYSVKEIAYDLGYAYPNDFSRAYKAFFGHPPSNLA